MNDKNTMMSINELRNNVNEFDKKHQIHLKHPDIWAEPYSYRMILETRVDMNTSALMCILNGVPIKDYFITDEEDDMYGAPTIPIGVMHAEFCQLSLLNWLNMNRKYDTNTLIFRCRFLTLVLASMLGSTHNITKRKLKYSAKFKYHSTNEQAILSVQEFQRHIIKFINIMIDDDAKYENIILKVNEYVSCSKKKVEHEKLKKTLNGHILELRKNMKKDLFTRKRFLDDDMAIYQILKIAYMLATNRTDVKKIPSFAYIENATVKHDLSSLIKELGKQIVKRTDRKYTPMFKAFIDARPLIYSQFSSDKSFNLHIGILALGYTMFVMDEQSNRDICKFIKEMLKRGK